MIISKHHILRTYHQTYSAHLAKSIRIHLVAQQLGLDPATVASIIYEFWHQHPPQQQT